MRLTRAVRKDITLTDIIVGVLFAFATLLLISVVGITQNLIEVIKESYARSIN